MIFGILKPYPSPLISGRGIDLDFAFLAGCLALLGLGLVMITSASSEVAAVQSGNPLYHMFRHLVYVAIGLVAGGVTMLVPIARAPPDPTRNLARSNGAPSASRSSR